MLTKTRQSQGSLGWLGSSYRLSGLGGSTAGRSNTPLPGQKGEVARVGVPRAKLFFRQVPSGLEMLYLIGWLYVNAAEQCLGIQSRPEASGRVSRRLHGGSPLKLCLLSLSGLTPQTRWLAGSAAARLVAKMRAKARGDPKTLLSPALTLSLSLLLLSLAASPCLYSF